MAERLPYRFEIEGRPIERREDTRTAIVEAVSPSYFHVMNIGLRDGRLLTEADTAAATKVAVISRSLATRNFGGENPLGKKLQTANDESASWFTIVGIVDDVRYDWVVKEDVPTLYFSYDQRPTYYTTGVVRANGDPMKLVSAARAQIAAIGENAHS